MSPRHERELAQIHAAACKGLKLPPYRVSVSRGPMYDLRWVISGGTLRDADDLLRWLRQNTFATVTHRVTPFPDPIECPR